MGAIPISGPPGGPPGGKPPTSSGASQRPAGEDSDRFERMLEQRRDKDAGAEKDRAGSHHRDKDEQGAGMSPGELLLRSLQGAEAPAKVEAAAARGAIDTLAGQIADRVLVSKDGLAGGSEVRIQLKESVLPDTEIRIARVEGRLQVELLAGSATALDALRGQDAVLQGKLQDRLQQEVVVVLGSGGAEAGQGDGRSRQRRNLIEEQGGGE
jgi:type III secretion system needle length determinant